MSLENAYNSCDTQLPDHYCDPCPDNREFGRVRSVALVEKSYLATLISADPTLAASWQDGIDAGSIIVIPETSGTYDPGDPKELKGYGDRVKSWGPRTHKLNYMDPNYVDNYQFYNTITDASQYVAAWRTSGVIHLADVTASIVAKDPVADDLQEEVTWNVTVEWVSKNLASLHDATLLSGIFSCS